MAKPDQKAIDRLVDWFVQHGGYVHPSLRFAQDAYGGVAGFAAEDISNPPTGGLHLMTCPLKLQLSHLQAPESIQGQLPEHVLRNIALIRETLLGEESLWAPYIECLPKSEQMNTPIFFSEEKTQEAINEKRNDTAWLLGTNLDKAWRPRAEQWKEEWKNAVQLLKKQDVDVEGYTWELYKWAATIFTSRSFISDPGMSKNNEAHAVLMPVIDLLNHRFPAKVFWFFDHGAFQFKTEEVVAKGQEIFNNYGGKDNEELLNGYGFCIPNNPCDVVAIRFGQLPPPITDELGRLLGKWDPAQTHYIRGRDHLLGPYQVSLPDYPEVTSSGVPQTIWTVMEVLKRFQDEQQGQRAKWRSTLSARCDLFEILATKYDNIDQFCDYLPESPRNLKQQYAKIYRDSQMKILKENHADVEKLIEKANFTSLDDAVKALKEDKEEVGGKSWISALEINFKTDDLASLREQGVEREAWILWLCAAWLTFTTMGVEESSRISTWLKDILESHPYNETESESHLPMPVRQLRAHADGIWQDPNFSAELYNWAGDVVDAEARMLAYLDDNEHQGKLFVCMKD
ncbi:Ribosomal lysine N-methyltransferase set10 [Lasiodiplodia theobromae]|uniref:Ribosomal lysine N-methyltransferase set10 n=1 Tax=Lasiodiplodia theobromae TaxID=45133 RepID=A0A5N5DCX2_9PEZI|nr:Ribosomal lysine N-methyltransferase set10 [Lasiodiplodia theobromae]